MTRIEPDDPDYNDWLYEAAKGNYVPTPKEIAQAMDEIREKRAKEKEKQPWNQSMRMIRDPVVIIYTLKGRKVTLE